MFSIEPTLALKQLIDFYFDTSAVAALAIISWLKLLRNCFVRPPQIDQSRIKLKYTVKWSQFNSYLPIQ